MHLPAEKHIGNQIVALQIQLSSGLQMQPWPALGSLLCCASVSLASISGFQLPEVSTLQLALFHLGSRAHG